ncbi:hypothetical protein EMIHUDRAFT_117727 [Emiliania huxleyi CCMP1516]|uniref:Uncharacterized protein n=2 Tax=Emiliania huxleyi TaxID=2903 RepID=A0A0D3J9I6_EMIH1|nr:hypothetical protein EMIHUDRAFT_117727 [Emiliania huxleyi CCMP1516]EOD20171.1 hypothetical protein EMIHUDRAFT_117727 [Emiliania huxleyi CCMP1516]|eukprot:XP_005772600.1 hypothetical protein EMIHUDRAFT_117727 [Emiliania huxleyi CCMP1516]
METASKEANLEDGAEVKTDAVRTDTDPPKPGCLARASTELTTADWLAVWVGLLCFLPLLPLALLVVPGPETEADPVRVKYLLPQPMDWASDPFASWDQYNATLTWPLLALMGATYWVYLRLTGKLGKTAPIRYLVGFIVVSLLGTGCLWLGRYTKLSSFGVSYAIYAIFIGMFLGNVAELSPSLSAAADKWLLPVAKDGEFMIKIALVLYAKSYGVIWSIGLPGIIVGWVGSPLAVMAGWFIGTRLLGMDNRAQVMLLSVGAAWCGASGMAAVQPIVGATGDELTLCISIVVLFTLAFQLLQPYFAIWADMDDAVAGAWIGASVDQTGNVLVSAAIVSDEATEVGGVVKMILNAGLGFICLGIAIFWSLEDAKRASRQSATPARAGLGMLWQKFPKFVLGFLLLSLIVTLLESPLAGTAAGVAIPRACSSLSTWWMCIAFINIGITTSCSKLFKGVTSGGGAIVKLYLLANTVDIALGLGLAYVCFGGNKGAASDPSASARGGFSYVAAEVKQM